MVWVSSLGLPMSLDGVAKALRLDVQKDQAIRRFAIPSKDGGRVLPGDDPVTWMEFVSYNQADVDVEVALGKRLAKHPCPRASGQPTPWISVSTTPESASPPCSPT